MPAEFLNLNLNLGPQLGNFLSPYATNVVGTSNVLGTMNSGNGNLILNAGFGGLNSLEGLFD